MNSFSDYSLQQEDMIFNILKINITLVNLGSQMMNNMRVFTLQRDKISSHHTRKITINKNDNGIITCVSVLSYPGNSLI